MRRKLDPASPEFRDLVKSTTSAKFSFPPLSRNEKMMTGVADADREVLMKLDDRELFTICLSPKNKYSMKLCNEDFFRNRTMKFLPGYGKFKNPDISWKKFYVYTRQISDFIDANSLERFLKYKNTPLFMDMQAGFLAQFFRNLCNGQGLEEELCKIIAPLIIYEISSMEIALKVVIILQALKLKQVPKNFMQYFSPIETLGLIHLMYVNDETQIRPALKIAEQQIDEIYQRIIGKNLQFLSFWEKVFKI